MKETNPSQTAKQPQKAIADHPARPGEYRYSFMFYMTASAAVSIISIITTVPTKAESQDSAPTAGSCTSDLSSCDRYTGAGTGTTCEAWNSTYYDLHTPKNEGGCSGNYPYFYGGNICCATYSCAAGVDYRYITADTVIQQHFGNCVVPTTPPLTPVPVSTTDPSAPPPLTTAPGPGPAISPPPVNTTPVPVNTTPCPTMTPMPTVTNIPMTAAPEAYKYGGEGIPYTPPPAPIDNYR